MKVRETLNKPSGLSEALGKEDRKVSASKDVSFQSQLRQVENKNVEERISELVNQITEQGEKLGKKIDIRELKIYKNLISEFMDMAVGNSHKFSKQSFLDRRGRHRVYAVIKRVDEELENLTKDVLKDEKDNIGILKRLDDIRGLILDMIM